MPQIGDDAEHVAEVEGQVDERGWVRVIWPSCPLGQKIRTHSNAAVADLRRRRRGNCRGSAGVSHTRGVLARSGEARGHKAHVCKHEMEGCVR